MHTTSSCFLHQTAKFSCLNGLFLFLVTSELHKNLEDQNLPWECFFHLLISSACNICVSARTANLCDINWAAVCIYELSNKPFKASGRLFSVTTEISCSMVVPSPLAQCGVCSRLFRHKALSGRAKPPCAFSAVCAFGPVFSGCSSLFQQLIFINVCPDSSFVHVDSCFSLCSLLDNCPGLHNPLLEVASVGSLCWLCRMGDNGQPPSCGEWLSVELPIHQ